MRNFINLITGIFNPLTKYVDEILTSDQKRQAAKIKLEEIKKQSIDKAIEFQSNLIDSQTDVLKNEASENWLQRTWRPLLMLCFGYIILYQYFISHLLQFYYLDNFPEFEVPQEFWTLLQIGIGGYVAARSIEKITPKIVEGNTKRKAAETEVENLNKQIELITNESLSGKEIIRAGREKRRQERMNKRELRRAVQRRSKNL